jgi:metal-responsive CopG/Arc/MetJ family transcriptional regulator
MTKRINVVMPTDTVRTIDRMVRPGRRSEFITRAVEHYVATQSAEAIQKLLEVTAVRDRDLDQQVAEDWFEVDQQSWQHIDQQPNSSKQPIPSGAKSTSRR